MRKSSRGRREEKKGERRKLRGRMQARAGGGGEQVTSLGTKYVLITGII